MSRSSTLGVEWLLLAACTQALPPSDSSAKIGPPPTARPIDRPAFEPAPGSSASAPLPVAEPPGPVACLTRFYDAVAQHDPAGWSVTARGGDPIPYGDLVQIYEQRYPTGPIHPVTEVDFDPGRVRFDSLFLATYGGSAKEVEAALVRVTLAGKTVLVHRKIAEPLRRVAKRVD